MKVFLQISKRSLDSIRYNLQNCRILVLVVAVHFIFVPKDKGKVHGKASNYTIHDSKLQT